MSPLALDDRIAQYLELARIADSLLVAHEPEPSSDDPVVVRDDQYLEH